MLNDVETTVVKTWSRKGCDAAVKNVTEPVDDEEEMADADSDGVPGWNGVIIATRIL